MRKTTFPSQFPLSQKREGKLKTNFPLLRRKRLLRGESVFQIFALGKRRNSNGRKWPDNCVSAKETQLCPLSTMSSQESQKKKKFLHFRSPNQPVLMGSDLQTGVHRTELQGFQLKKLIERSLWTDDHFSWKDKWNSLPTNEDTPAQMSELHWTIDERFK